VVARTGTCLRTQVLMLFGRRQQRLPWRDQQAGNLGNPDLEGRAGNAAPDPAGAA
jgi:hypothetical protein